MTPEHPHYEIIQNDVRYKHLEGNIPLGESLQDCQTRSLEAWQDIVEDIQKADPTRDHSRYSLLVAHANTLRALVMHIDNIPPEEIEDLNIPTAIPFYYDIDKTTGQVLNDEGGGAGRFSGVYIADERKKRSFLERRRAANDPWLWALHDNQVSRSLLVDDGTSDEGEFQEEEEEESLDGIEAEAAHNTQLFSPTSRQGDEVED